MKKTRFTNLIAGVLAMFILGILAVTITPAPSMAADVMLEAEILKADVKLNKNGDEYVVILIQVDKVLNGVAYKDETIAMARGTKATMAKSLQAGDMLKAIAKTNEYNGNTNYEILAFVN